MKFALTLLPIVAALGFVGAGRVGDGLTQLTPKPVTKLVCNGANYWCTASLDYADRWIAQWSTVVFHQGLFGPTEERMTSMAPVPVTQVKCDGHKCTANLEYDDGRWVAEWSVILLPGQQALFSHEVVGALDPGIPVTKLTCDGDTSKCTGNLDNTGWAVQWDSHVFRTGFLNGI